MREPDALRAYVPGLVSDWLADCPDASWRMAAGTLVFADISGFTKLTERCARVGAVGAEELSDILSAVFSDLLGIAYRYGGRLVKWGGDAILLLFEGYHHAAVACQVAWRMRAQLRRSGKIQGTFGSATLRMSVGVHSGQVPLFLVGTRHHELIITGPAATQVALVEAAAEAGEIAVSPATAGLLAPQVLGESKGAFRLLRAAPHAAQPGPQVSRDVSGLDLAGCLPPQIRDHVLAGASDDDGEHRRVAAGFVEFSGASELLDARGPDALAAALHDLISLAQDSCLRYDVTFLESDISPAGGKLLLVAGAPRSAGQDGERLLRTLRAIVAGQAAAAAQGAGPVLPVRAGANAGRVFAGAFGPGYRRTYSVKGDAINLAARVAGKARWGHLLATTATMDRPAAVFGCVTVPPFRVKGKDQPVHACEIGAPLGTPRPGDKADTPLVGRDAELGLLSDRLTRARAGRGSAVVVGGAPGIGKSRLVAELLAGAAPDQVLSVACDMYEAGTPYALFGAVLRTLLGRELGLEDGVSADAAAAGLADVVQRQAPALLPWLPLLAAVLGAELPMTPEVAALADEFRRTRLERAVTELLAILLPGPSVITVDDVHVIDDASADLLNMLLMDVPTRPWLVVLTQADGGSFTPPAEAGVTRIVLRPLPAADASALLAWQTEAAPLLPHLAAAIAERAEGNPLFLRELVQVASNEGSGALPESVEDVIGTQIDRLDPPDRSTLRAAAVAGMQVDPALLAEAVGQPPAPGVWQRLAAFLEPDPSGHELRFRHALVRDAAYEGLSFRQRRRLHGRLGRALERRSSGDAEDAGRLTAHFFHAEAYDSATHYARIAGEHAAAVYANVEAARFMSLALEAAKGKRPPVPEEMARLAETLGDVCCRLGEFTRAGTAFAEARKLVKADPAWLARLRLKTALVVSRTSGFAQALGWITRGRRVLAGVADLAAQRQDAELVVHTALVRHMQGRYRDAQRACQTAIEAAKRSGARDVLAQALQLLDAGDVARGHFGGEPWAERALAIWEELGELSWQAKALNQLGIRAYFEGRWNDALASYRRGAATFEKVGDQWNAAIAACNVGEILSDQGRYGEADEVVRPALRLLQASGALSETAFALSVLGRTAARCGRYEEAGELLDAARQGYAKAGEPGEVLAIEIRIAESLAQQGRTADALARTAAAEQAAPQVAAAQQPAVNRIRGYALAQRGEADQARAVFEASVRTARERAARYEEALSLDALIRFDGHLDRPADASATTARDALFGQLGLVTVPEFPLRPRGEQAATLR
jgi:class 3 adenylate cyclase/tetratricopeptide (TPR) repeat protein